MAHILDLLLCESSILTWYGGEKYFYIPVTVSIRECLSSLQTLTLSNNAIREVFPPVCKMDVTEV